MVKILYVHGYMGKGNGSASNFLRQSLNKHQIEYSLDAPDFPVTDRNKMKTMLFNMSKNYDILVASSLGAFYSMQIPDLKKILVNPALPKDLMKIRDKDPDNNTLLTDDFINMLENDKNSYFSVKHNEHSNNITYFVFGSNDNIANNKEFLNNYFPQKNNIVCENMGHKLNDVGADTVAKTIIKIVEENNL